MRRLITAIIMLVTIFTSTFAYAGFTDVSESEVYSDSANRLKALGIINGTSDTEFSPQDMITREQFSIIIVKTAGLKDTAETMMGSTVFSDVEPDSPSSGYISVAVSNGFISGLMDGRFHPGDYVTFAQVSTAAVRALGYTDKDLTGLWPKNYIEKASDLKLTEGLNLKYTDNVPKWAMALIIDRLLDTNIKKNSPSDKDMTLATAKELYTECIILDNSLTSNKLAENQVLTSKGIYYLGDKNLKLELGNTYRLQISDDDTILREFGAQRRLENISVDSVVDTKVSYRNDNNEVLYKTLPDKTVYYYQGNIVPYDKTKDILKARSSITFAYNENESGYDYAVIYDPIYSKPEVARNFQPSAKQIGAISIPSNISVVREGELSDVLHIREKDVVYGVSDIWNRQKHIEVINNKVGGKVTNVLPDKVNPKTIQVDGKDFSISTDIDINKLKIRPGSLNEDDNIVMLLGRDGKIVDTEYPGNEDNSEYALVLNSSIEIEANASNSKLDKTYSVKLLTADGITATYYSNRDAMEFKGKLVRYKFEDRNTVSLEDVLYNFPKDLTVDKVNRSINGDYTADNIRIFNIISDEEGADVEANLLDFQNLPQGNLPDNKIFYMEKSGPFSDISVMLTNDIRGEKYKPAIIKKTSLYSNGKSFSYIYTLLVEGKEYTYNEMINGATVGSVVNVKLYKDSIKNAEGARDPSVEASSVEAYDSRRIKIKGNTYWLKNNISVYFVDYERNVKVKSLADVQIDQFYGNISLYFDKPVDQGGMVDVIVVKQ